MMNVCRVLIVDDTLEDRQVYVRLLASSTNPRFEIAEAERGEDGVAHCVANPPDCVLVDYDLPDMTGLEFLAELREARPDWPFAIVMITGQGDEHIAVQAMKHGVQDYLSKGSLTQTKLRLTVASALEKVALLRKIDEQQAELSKLYYLERERTAQLQQQVEQRDRFIAILSHELRNPLGAIVVAVHSMLEAPGDQGLSAQAIEVIERQGRHMSRMIDELLDEARITRGQIELKRESVSVRSLVDGAVQSCQNHLHQRRQTLTVELPDEDAFLDADATRIEQVLVNLIKNASKFTPDGGQIAVEVLCDAQYVELRVRDNGIGIEARMIDVIFDPFMQANTSVDRSGGGLGLGLAVVKQLVDMHGGTISAASDGLETGSTFTVRLPRGIAPVAPPPPQPPVKPNPRRIVVIEDSQDVRTMMCALLKALGHVVQAAEDGPSGIESIRQFAPDVALIDIGLPLMDGYEVARHLRAHQNGHRLKLVALTGYGQDDDRRRAFAAGFDAHLTKPIKLPELNRLLAEELPAADESPDVH